ncbi:unnamed protein product, partial [Callosobruchus maculatus]
EPAPRLVTTWTAPAGHVIASVAYLGVSSQRDPFALPVKGFFSLPARSLSFSKSVSPHDFPLSSSGVESFHAVLSHSALR